MLPLAPEHCHVLTLTTPGSLCPLTLIILTLSDSQGPTQLALFEPLKVEVIPA